MTATQDPTTTAIDAQNNEREKLRTEVERLERALEVVTADRDRITKLGDALFVEGYDEAVREIRDHFKKVQETEIVAEIEKIWMKDKRS